MNKTFKRKIMIHLRKLGNREIKPKNSNVGICSELSNKFDVYNVVTFIDKRTKTWPKFTGYFGYPIPHSKYNASMAFQMLANLWDARTTYGKDRLELCLHIADVLKKELANGNYN